MCLGRGEKGIQNPSGTAAWDRYGIIPRMKRVLLFIAVALFLLPIAYMVFWVRTQGFNPTDRFWSGTMGNMGATVYGVAVGIPAGLLLNRWVEQERAKKREAEQQDESEKEERRVFDLLHKELSANLASKLFPDSERLTSPYQEVPPDPLETGAWDAVTASGETKWIRDTELRSKITNAYHLVKSLNKWLERWYDAAYGVGVAIKVKGEGGQSLSLASEVARVLLNLASQHRPYIEMVVLKLRKTTSKEHS